MSYRFLMTGGGTGGHIFPALAVARLLRERGHDVLFAGTPEGMEARLAPEAGFRMEFIRIGGFNRAGLRKQARTALQLPVSIGAAILMMGRWRPDAVFSMGGYVAGPVALAAVLRRVPLIVMEPNAVPGVTNRRLASFVYRALVGFEATKRWFPPGQVELTGVPIREEFFRTPPKAGGPFTLLITGGSRGSRTLNRASSESWPLFRSARIPIRIIHQCGMNDTEDFARQFAASGLEGEVVPFIRDMPGAFAQADLVLGRSGAGSVGEIAAAGMASILVPFPFAADDHQRKNAEAFVDAGAARMILDRDLTGERLFREVEDLRQNPSEREIMRERVRRFARPEAAERAAEVLEEAAARKKVRKL
ncbi:MAG TPA: undecaprenyldiphospho-muramoylpentapeptide beta-N-acetylglucosaminyltransferase [Bryobacteraceae bacterium]|jgi:UDP-N-acetylglucosamine--N-acetylmuramyl-(pentapeptide) pyrophosphoryl-undecaprenol N-acetylglucosamine transferase|nr:undecaprenyldiphospho-muramoylpentapeptide beta-N-acetylglucosaminyltransferase [Bryobacteraceae bacterium]